MTTMKLFVLTYRHRHDDDVFAHTTEGGAIKHAADLCLEHLSEVHPKFADAIGLAHARKDYRTVIELFETNSADTNHPERMDIDAVDVIDEPRLADTLTDEQIRSFRDTCRTFISESRLALGEVTSSPRADEAKERELLARTVCEAIIAKWTP
jgi:hypothetical protein